MVGGDGTVFGREVRLHERLFAANLTEIGLCHHRSRARESSDGKGGSFWLKVA